MQVGIASGRYWVRHKFYIDTFKSSKCNFRDLITSVPFLFNGHFLGEIQQISPHHSSFLSFHDRMDVQVVCFSQHIRFFFLFPFKYKSRVAFRAARALVTENTVEIDFFDIDVAYIVYSKELVADA